MYAKISIIYFMFCLCGITLARSEEDSCLVSQKMVVYDSTQAFPSDGQGLSGDSSHQRLFTQRLEDTINLVVITSAIAVAVRLLFGGVAQRNDKNGEELNDPPDKGGK